MSDNEGQKVKVIVQTEAISRLVHANKEFSSKFSHPPPPPSPVKPLLISLIYQVIRPCYILSFSRCCILRGNLVHYFPNLASTPQKSPFTFKILAPHFVDSHWFSFYQYTDAHDFKYYKNASNWFTHTIHTREEKLPEYHQFDNYHIMPEATQVSKHRCFSH